MGKPRRWRATAAAIVMTLAGLTVLTVVAAPAGASPARPAGPATETRPETASACSLAPTTGVVTHRFTSGPSINREYRLYVPAGLSGNARLLISLHGWNPATPQDHENRSHLTAFADQFDYIIAFPQGTYPVPAWFLGIPVDGRGWNYMDTDSADVTFARQVVQDISARYCVDSRRVYAEGISMGGLMAQRLACDASDVFASVSGLATNDVQRPWFDRPDWPSDPCTLDRRTSIYLSCGAHDPFTDQGCAPARNAWSTRNGCATAPEVSDPFGIYRYQQSCASGSQVLWRRWSNEGHDYPGLGWPGVSPIPGTRQQYWTEMALFFGANPRPL